MFVAAFAAGSRLVVSVDTDAPALVVGCLAAAARIDCLDRDRTVLAVLLAIASEVAELVFAEDPPADKEGLLVAEGDYTPAERFLELDFRGSRTVAEADIVVGGNQEEAIDDAAAAAAGEILGGHRGSQVEHDCRQAGPVPVVLG
jgi:hypothetical protein